MNILITSAIVFGAVKYLFEFFSWLSIDKDKIFRKHLDRMWESLNQYTFYDLALLSIKRIVSRLKLSKPSVFIAFILFFILIPIINYAVILFSLSIMAKDNVNFDLSDKSITEIARILFRELGFTGSQQILWMLLGTSLSSIFGFFLARKLIISINQIPNSLQLIFLIGRLVGIILVSAFITILFMYLSVKLYDWGSNTETQQYLLTQTYRMFSSFERPLPTIIILNSLAASFPTLLFLFLFLIFAILKITPNFIRKGINYLVYRFTTDKKPILNQLGTFFGGLAGLITAVLSLVGKN